MKAALDGGNSAVAIAVYEMFMSIGSIGYFACANLTSSLTKRSVAAATTAVRAVKMGQRECAHFNCFKI